MLVKESKELQEYTTNFVDFQWQERDFVKEVRDYIHCELEKVLLVNGLRGTGKTVGLLQAIHGLDAIYITAEKNEEASWEEYLQLLKTVSNEIIVIDEYSWIQKREQLDGFLFTLVQHGKRVIITGTDSVHLNFLKYGNLIHRVMTLHVTYFSYLEYLKVFQLADDKETCEEYLREGGLFKEYLITSKQTMDQYLKTAVFNPIVSYFDGRFQEVDIRNIVYTVLYKAVCNSTQNVVPLLKRNQVSLQDFLADFGVNPSIPIRNSIFEEITDILERIGLIVIIRNYVDKQLFRTYLTNPSLCYQLIKCVYDLQVVPPTLLGSVYEATCVSYAFYNTFGDHVLYYATNHDDGKNHGSSSSLESYEIDFLILDSGNPRAGAWLFECKKAAKVTLKETASLVSDYIDDLFPDGEIFGRYVIYNGDLKIERIHDREVIYLGLKDFSLYYDTDNFKKE